MNKFNPTEHPRIADGTFTDKEFSAPEISLSPASSTADGSRATHDYAIEMRHADPARSRDGSAALFAEVERTVRQMRRRMGLTDDQTSDAIGDTLEDLAKRVKNGHTVQGGLIQIAANAVCSRYVNGPIRHETAKAIRILKERIAVAEAQAGHHITSAEIARLAENIRMGDDFNKHHRPQEDFHLIQDFIRPTSFSQFPDSYIDEQMHTFGYSIGSVADSERLHASESLADLVEGKEITRAEAILRVWNVIADDQDAPRVAENVISKKDAAAVSKHLTSQMNGVIDACRQHELGISNKNTVALFAPFGPLTPAQRDNVVQVLTKRSGRAEDLWGAALLAATKSKDVEADERRAARDRKTAGVEAKRVAREVARSSKRPVGAGK